MAGVLAILATPPLSAGLSETKIWDDGRDGLGPRDGAGEAAGCDGGRCEGWRAAVATIFLEMFQRSWVPWHLGLE